MTGLFVKYRTGKIGRNSWHTICVVSTNSWPLFDLSVDSGIFLNCIQMYKPGDAKGTNFREIIFCQILLLCRVVAVLIAPKISIKKLLFKTLRIFGYKILGTFKKICSWFAWYGNIRYNFLSNQNIHISWCVLCFSDSNSLIDRF